MLSKKKTLFNKSLLLYFYLPSGLYWLQAVLIKRWHTVVSYLYSAISDHEYIVQVTLNIVSDMSLLSECA